MSEVAFWRGDKTWRRRQRPLGGRTTLKFLLNAARNREAIRSIVLNWPRRHANPWPAA
jgi:hypothetical protein